MKPFRSISQALLEPGDSAHHSAYSTMFAQHSIKCGDENTALSDRRKSHHVVKIVQQQQALRPDNIQNRSSYIDQKIDVANYEWK